MRVLISGGGTGGHIYPALSVATLLRDTYHADILYLGSDDGMETKLVPEAGFRLLTVKAGKLQRFIAWKTVVGVARVPVGMAQAVGIVRRFRPDVAFTSGGYVAVPAGIAARINGVPLLIHQQDVSPNLSNRLIAPQATRISVAFVDSLQYFPAQKTVHLGNPVRQAILDVRQRMPEQARAALGFDPNLPLLLVTGASSGARHLNQATCQILATLLPRCQVLHISGPTLFEETRPLAESAMAGLDAETRQRYRLVPYMSDEMPLAMQAASLVLCRSGASTLSELAVLQKPAILVPLPPGFGGSPQEINARMFEQHQAATLLLDSDLKSETLVERINSIIDSPDRLQTMAKAAGQLAKLHATHEIVETIVKMAKNPVEKTSQHEVLNI
ncbi:undecaprenyldiphospho-muramoylpentapeptide beta-N- acetylglucosaminyltransferase [Reticulibacter mediterranei]|uniref:UDP-N-acetylglucosamine--N-acetylmuramyl-(pentapeptide) pyrophosphoryl-undecaprenol N-acetylglucosamine transferase n=1 Tax=Reticulibacter mediterranei TaxID=2778369 RepID=A0A8J3IFZ0_9CHLR|nr:UDP-N-acetylglucosamine--N-acetylmuramyl-(pentapeptide) pyrophosphoryl-undecaprenol N-acetylglucosamine transferase [Reticulibacter mediterranei]GHO92853.1 undecaprenyldiphospho-muramoylpentapeptide beta-N- acetylglucosaminyltransferase [Reticulibacter mediterranei]